MDIIGKLFEISPAVLGVSFWGILMLYWCTDFFGFLREMLLGANQHSANQHSTSQHKIEQLEEKIQQLENQLTSLKVTEEEARLTYRIKNQPSYGQDIISV